MIKLGVNVDHVATLRQARRTHDPDPVLAALKAEAAGGDTITVHLREDRRHIQDRDVFRLRETIQTSLNLEMAVRQEIVEIALQVRPDFVCLVPENRQEITTEGGLEVSLKEASLSPIVERLKAGGIEVAVFIDPNQEEIQAAKAVGVNSIEIHTGAYANAMDKNEREKELKRIKEAATLAHSLGMIVNAGHGLNYDNVKSLILPELFNEFNIGHSIISRAIFVGLERAVSEMKALLS